jgi:hypothetical protein
MAAQHGLLGPASWVNVFYFDVTPGSHTPGEVIAAVAETVQDLYDEVFSMSSFPSDWSTTWVTCTYRDTSSSTVRVRVADALAGSGGASLALANACYLINWSTGDPRRGGKPRQYIAGVPDGACTDSVHVAASLLSGWNTNLITWLTAMVSETIPHQLVEMSFRDGNAWRSSALSYPILGGSVNPVIATQRRRVDRQRPV